MIKDILKKNENIKSNSREIKILKEYFPGYFSSDGEFDSKKFLQMINENVQTTQEGYELNFLGKNYAKLVSSLDTTTMIKPDIQHNEGKDNKDSENIYISGDNLDALNHLLKSYASKIKCIYIDPPYNTGTDDFVYKDNFSFSIDELQKTLSIDEDEARRISELTTRGAASDSAWMTFMYPRLQLAQDLLSNDGIIFVSIDDNEQANLKLLMDDIFGVENFVTQIIVQSNKRGQTYKQIAKTHEYLLVYTKNIDTKINELEKEIGSFSMIDDIGEFSERELRNRNPKFGKFNRPNLFYPIYVNPNKIDKNGYSPVSLVKDNEFCIEVLPYNSEGEASCWRWGKEGKKKEQISKFEANNNKDNSMLSNVVARKKTTGEFGIYEKYRKTTYKAKTIWFNELLNGNLDDEDDDIWEETNVITEQGSTELKEYGMSEAFDFPKPVYLIKKVMMIGSNEDSICLDFFSGSATTAEAIMSLNAQRGNRKYILVQLPENLDDKYKNSPNAKKAKIEKTINYLDSINKKHTLDQIGLERIRRAAEKISKENPESEFDKGFKHYELQEFNNNLLSRMTEFDENSLLCDADIINEIGTETVLVTYMVHDGYGFNSNVEEVEINNYKMYWCDKHLYLLNPGMNEDVIIGLIKKYNDDINFKPNNIVVFGYSFTEWTISEMLEKNIKQLKDSDENLKINIDVRY